jgi:hypothetical protein
LTHRENFVEKFSAALGFLSGVIAFLSDLIMIMPWLHFLVPLNLNVYVSSFLLMLSFMILAVTTIVAPVVLQNDILRMSGINERYLTTAIHFEYNKVHRYERIPNSHQDSFLIQ